MKTAKIESYDNIVYLPNNTTVASFTCPDAKAFIELVATISARMVNVQADILDHEIILSLADIFTHLDAGRGGLLEVKEFPSVVNVSHAWYRDGVAQIPEEVNVVDHYPWAFHKVLVKENILALTKAKAFPEEADVDRVSYEAFGNKSSLVIPLMVGERVTHVFGIDVLDYECAWPVEIIRNLKMVGEIFVNALQRKKFEDQLLRMNSRMELAASSAGAGLWEFNRHTENFWTTSQARALFDFTPEEQISLESFLEKVHPEDKQKVTDSLKRLSSPDDELFVEYRTQGLSRDKWMHSRGRLLRLNGSGQEVVMGVTVDVSARKEAEQEMTKRLKEIEGLRQQLEKENTYLRQSASAVVEDKAFLGASDSVKAVISQAAQVAGTDSTVLIQGETGTGKELLAQLIHNKSQRSGRTMVKVNCAALPDALVESELFGREKGAYTGALSKQIGRFELADGSTLFLDEISEMPMDAQVKLLRVLQEGEFQRLGNPRTVRANVRVIAASNRNLLSEVEKGRFRRDLYYRLSIFPVRIPPLREHPEDVPQMVWTFINKFNGRMGKMVRKVTKADMAMLQSYPWPGNVRELRNVIEHAMIVSNGEALAVKPLDVDLLQSDKPTRLVDVERQHIESILKMTSGRIKGRGGAAELLAMNPSTLYSRMRKLGIHPS